MKNQTKIRFLFIFIFVFQILGADEMIYILHTNNTNGTLENCYCPDRPLGSVEKRAAFITEFIKKNPNSLVLDAGDIFAVTNRNPLKDSLVCEAYAFIPYDGILLGDQEITRDLTFLNSVLPKTGASLIATNLQYPRPPGLVPYRIIKRGEVRIGIMGVIGPVAMKYYPEDIRTEIALKAPLVAINETLPEIRAEVDIVVVLSHQGMDRDVRLAQQLKDVDVIIGAHSQSVLKEPVIENGILIMQAGKDGFYVGIIEIKLDEQMQVISKSGKLKPMTLEMPDDPRILALISEYEKQTGFVNRRKQKLQEQ